MKWFLASSLLLFSCGGDSAGTALDMASPVGTLCTDARADGWNLPIDKPSNSGAFQVSLLSSAASPPLIGDTTAWTLQIADAHGAMVSGAAIDVKPWMPDHGHGTSIVASATAMTTPGQYLVKPLYLFMAGYWTVTFTITSGAVSDTIVYSLCLSDA
jgi:hypothetical protein